MVIDSSSDEEDWMDEIIDVLYVDVIRRDEENTLSVGEISKKNLPSDGERRCIRLVRTKPKSRRY